MHPCCVCGDCSLHRCGELTDLDAVALPFGDFGDRIIVMCRHGDTMVLTDIDHILDALGDEYSLIVLVRDDFVDFGVVATSGFGHIVAKCLVCRVLSLTRAVIHDRHQAYARLAENLAE